ncbi:Putative beta-lactamase/transpeptidase [Septoria linicola]|uniref:Beta-lactamase/transpeptidase n=1 Tax=Septoria linicola TaxID=215465 RepID=A0A9Q9EKM4_9PEZI|nr:Putative beta-lactamase/transpeptidase [Septoria linicola]
MASAKATLQNWMSHPRNQWAFFHRQPRGFGAFELHYDGGKLDLSAYLARSNTDGLMVLQDGKVVYERYSNGNTAESKHIIMSLTKSITGLLIGILQDKGKLSVHDAVTKHVPEVENTIWEQVTVGQCLDMRSGAKYVDGQHEYRAASGWNPLHGDEKHGTLKQFLGNFEPDEVIDYHFEHV